MSRMQSLKKSLCATLLGGLFFAGTASAQNVTTEILEDAQNLSDRWVHYGSN